MADGNARTQPQPAAVDQEFLSLHRFICDPGGVEHVRVFLDLSVGALGA